LQAFRAYEVQERIANTKAGCFLVVTLMPAGSLLDYYSYPDQLYNFLQLRLFCALLAAAIWAFLCTDLGRKSARWLGVVVPLLPAFFIAEMSAEPEGFASPSYAGLNLVLLAVGRVLRWTVWESVVAVSLVLLMYILAGMLQPPVKFELLVNNFY